MNDGSRESMDGQKEFSDSLRESMMDKDVRGKLHLVSGPP